MSYKAKIIDTLEQLQPRLQEISHIIHAHPETSNQEVFACDLLCSELLKHGFKVEKDIAGHSTGFIATHTSQRPGPTIGILVEYDALPGLGHACGHNLIAATSLGSALALSSILEETGGTLKVFGTPAEEGGVNGSAKASYVHAGLFKDVDVALMTHPGSHNQPTPKSLAIAPMDFEFFGKPAHAASCPEEGINALDALLLFYNGINALRQQLTSDVRIHGVILDGGTAPNIIPDYTRARFYLRADTRTSLEHVITKVKHIADGSALMTGCTTQYTHIQHVLDNLSPNAILDKLFIAKLQELGQEIDLTPHSMGSTDAGNVSHVIPTIHPILRICDCEIPPHTVEFANACISNHADSSIIIGAKALALTALDILTDESLLASIKASFHNSSQK